jgi:AraC-like DNA-binding protein
LVEALAQRATAGSAGGMQVRPLAQGPGWSAFDYLCTRRPGDRPFAEVHTEAALSLVIAGSFTYRGRHGRHLLTKGSLLIGEAAQPYQCEHEHGAGDRCLSFHYRPEFFEAAIVAAGGARDGLHRSSLGPHPNLSAVATRATLTLLNGGDFEEIALALAVQTARACLDAATPRSVTVGDERKVADAVRLIDERLDEPLSVSALAAIVGLSPFRFLHLFKLIAGTSPHQYRLRLRLRAAALRLLSTETSVTAVALASGFQDLSNFIRTFTREFGVSPTRYRRRQRPRSASRRLST